MNNGEKYRKKDKREQKTGEKFQEKERAIVREETVENSRGRERLRKGVGGGREGRGWEKSKRSSCEERRRAKRTPGNFGINGHDRETGNRTNRKANSIEKKEETGRERTENTLKPCQSGSLRFPRLFRDSWFLSRRVPRLLSVFLRRRSGSRSVLPARSIRTSW